MIVIAGIVIGAGLGLRSARRAGGVRADLVQYGIAGGIAGGLLGMVLTIVVERLVA